VNPRLDILINAAVFFFILGLLALGLSILGGCGDAPPPRPGTAASTAAGAQARVATAASAVDQADQAAALAAGRAAGATEAAKLDPTTARIAAAADARVEAASTAAVAATLHAQEAGLQAAENSAQVEAEAERHRDAEAQAYGAWVRLCRLVGLAGIAGGCLVGAAVAWLAKDPRLGAGIAAVLSFVGALVIGLGPASAWLPWLVPAVGVAALGAWARIHRRAVSAALAGSRAVDAVEREVGHKATAAKVALGAALTAAGLEPTVTRLRGPARDWTSP